MEGIIQVPIDASIGNTFAHCLRSILRQDPDKILVGEIRDLETAEIAVQASLTGHMVFSTLHTNDAASTITRLKDMGVPDVPDHRHGRGDPRPAAGPPGLHQVPRGVRPQQRNARRPGAHGRRPQGKTIFSWLRLRKLQQYRIQGPRRLVRAADHEQRAARHDHAQRLGGRAPRRGRQRAGMVTLRDAGMKACFEGMTSAEEVIRETILEA